MQFSQLINGINRLYILCCDRRSSGYVFIMLLTFLISCGKHYVNNPDSDWERWNLKGNVKSLSEVKFSESGKYLTTILFRENGFVSQQASYNPDKSLIRKWVFKYRNDNLKDKLYCYILDDSLSYVSIYGYDSRGNVTSVITDKSDSTLNTRSVILYDNEDHKLKESVYDANNDIVHETSFKYTQNLLTEEVQYDAILNQRWRQVNHFNQQQMIEETVSLSMQDSVLNTVTHAYHDNGKLKETISFNSDKNSLSKLSFAYSETGVEIERIRYLANGEKGEMQKRDYKYDKSGNWIFMSITINGNLQDITTREIVYYE
ncbi:MAG: hypothetical protein ABI663_22020 [Chryseolinea sp.]